jgi:hypothetical protein
VEYGVLPSGPSLSCLEQVGKETNYQAAKAWQSASLQVCK